MTDNNLVKMAAVVTSPELTDKVIFYFVDHGMKILTAIVLMGAGVFVARWVGNLLHRWLKSKAFDEPVSNLIALFDPPTDSVANYYLPVSFAD